MLTMYPPSKDRDSPDFTTARSKPPLRVKLKEPTAWGAGGVEGVVTPVAGVDPGTVELGVGDEVEPGAAEETPEEGVEPEDGVPVLWPTVTETVFSEVRLLALPQIIPRVYEPLDK